MGNDDTVTSAMRSVRVWRVWNMFNASLTAAVARNLEGGVQFDTKMVNNCTASLHIAAFSMHTAISS